MKSIRFILFPTLLIVFWGIFSSATVKVMPTGDSLTAAADPGYRGYLFQMLRDSGYTVDFVGGHQRMPSDPQNTDPDNSGFGGYVIGPDSSLQDSKRYGKGSASITYELDNHEKIMSLGADIIILMIGVNDFGNNRNTSYDPRKVGAIRLDSLIEKIYRLSPNVRLIVSNITPARWDLTGGNYNKFNNEVPIIVERQNKKGRACYFVDNCKGDFIKADYLDAVHFVASGYQKIAKNFYSVLAPILKSMGAVSADYQLDTPKKALYPNQLIKK